MLVGTPGFLSVIVVIIFIILQEVATDQTQVTQNSAIFLL